MKMTHGEIRGLLTLLGLMCIVVTFAYFTRSCRHSGTPPTSDGAVTFVSADSIADTVMLNSAAQEAVRADSLRQARRDSIRAVNSSTKQCKSKGAKATKTLKAPAPDKPSPIDCPVSAD